jgi:F-type H+-transporting ATPase subunit alpha
MKKVAGTLRLDLASYRELESFAQFGSDLDQATQAKLNRGARTVEILKQGLHKPLRVEKQVAVLYALTKGFLDDVPVSDITRFEDEYLTWLESNRKEVLESIRTTGGLPEAGVFESALEEFKKTFIASE